MFKTYALWILLSEGVGALGGFLTREASRAFSQQVAQPPLSPPAAVFPIVWGILFALMGVGAARVSLKENSTKELRLFGLQLGVNFLWTLLFFNARMYGPALVLLFLLLLLVLSMARAFYRKDRAAGWLQAPYCLWTAFALYLNAGVWYLNGLGGPR